MDKRETQVPYIKPCVFRISPLNFHIHNQPSTSSMYKLQISLVPINQRQTGPRYVHSSPSSIIMHQEKWKYTIMHHYTQWFVNDSKWCICYDFRYLFFVILSEHMFTMLLPGCLLIFYA